jgi:hypothetical protein
MGYTVAQVKEIAGKLRALPKIDSPPKDLTKSDVVKMLANEIKSLQKRGYTLEQIASSLKGEGLDISTSTLKSYMQKHKAPAVKAKAGTGNTGGKQVALEGAVSSDAAVATPKSEGLSDNKKARSSGSFAPRPDSVDL